MTLSRAGVRTLVAMGAVAAGLLLSGRMAQADCGRSAANEARPVYREDEKKPARSARRVPRCRYWL